MQYIHHCLHIEFDENNVYLDSVAVEAMDLLYTINHSEKISKNYFYLGRKQDIFYSMKFSKIKSGKQKLDLNLIPKKVIAQYFLSQKIICGVIGCKEDSDRFTSEVQEQALEAGRVIASYGFVTLTGGLSGVMSKAAEGARQKFGETLGILPGTSKEHANPHIQIVLPSGIGIARNYLIAQAADILIALNGGRGTLEEICYGLDFDKKVLSLNSWDISGVNLISSIEAVTPFLDEIFFREFLTTLNKKFEL
ncbi:MAG: LOG family protein [Rhizobacter sp.]|nr:LOG family protein [Bacteriovorax sp.]